MKIDMGPEARKKLKRLFERVEEDKRDEEVNDDSFGEEYEDIPLADEVWKGR